MVMHTVHLSCSIPLTCEHFIGFTVACSSQSSGLAMVALMDTALLTTEAPVRGWPWWGTQGPLTDQ